MSKLLLFLLIFAAMNSETKADELLTPNENILLDKIVDQAVKIRELATEVRTVAPEGKAVIDPDYLAYCQQKKDELVVTLLKLAITLQDDAGIEVEKMTAEELVELKK